MTGGRKTQLVVSEPGISRKVHNNRTQSIPLSQTQTRHRGIVMSFLVNADDRRLK